MIFDLEKELRSVDFVAKPIKYEKLNSQLTKCRCYVLASGRNANYSDIKLDAIKNSLPSLYNMPVVANLKKKEDGSGWSVGSHDIEITLNENNVEIRDLCVPYGVVPENCNPKYENVLEEDGITTNTYLAVDIYIWSGRYNILDAKYDDDIYFNQSCEILVNDGYEDENGYFVISDFIFSALCILGKSSDPKYNKRPCFPSCKIEKAQYSLDESKFKEDFALLMQEIKKFNINLESSQEETNLDINQTPTESEYDAESDTTNNYEEETSLADKTKVIQIDKEKINAKLFSIISENKFRSSTDKHYTKYEILSNTDSIVNVMDREDCYKIYSIPYLATETNDDIIVNIDYDNKVEKSFGIMDKTDDLFSIKKEVDMISDDTAEHKVAQYSSNTIATLRSDLETMTENYSKADAEIKRLTEQLSVFQKEKESFMAQKHKESIDTLIASKRDEMGNYSKFLDYCIEPDYTKSIEQVETELKEIRYGFLDSTSKHNKNAKFSVIETNTIETSSDGDIITKLYGAEIAKYLNKK